MTRPTTGTREQWLAARLELLQAEKELTRCSDELARRRRRLPWVAVEKDYVFGTDHGDRTLRAAGSARRLQAPDRLGLRMGLHARH